MLWYAPAWTLPQVVQAALPEMSRVAIYRSFSSLGYQIFVCMWDSTFHERIFGWIQTTLTTRAVEGGMKEQRVVLGT